MKTFLVSILCALSIVPSFSQDATCSIAPHSKYINEIALVAPINRDDVKNYINSSNITANPLTSGFGSGFQFGTHKIVNERATLGIAVASNAFFSSGTTTTQLYQLGTYLTGRLYFGETWRNGIFAEIAAGPEAAASSIQDEDFQFQANIGTRVGIGYNYQFNKDVTLGLSIVASPSLVSDNYLSGSRAVISMMW